MYSLYLFNLLLEDFNNILSSSLLSKLLTNLNILDEWCKIFLPTTKEGELTQKSRIVKFKLVDIAYLHIDPTLIINMDADPKPFISKNNKVTLKCKHAFHYNCILSAFKNDNSKHYKTKKNMCPYCRSSGGYLPLEPGVIPIKYIHKEYSDYANNTNITKETASINKIITKVVIKQIAYI